jgi:hypothetical protein
MTDTTRQDVLPLRLPSCDDRPIWDVMMSAGHFLVLTAADEAGLFSALESEPATSEQLAAMRKLDARATEATLILLTSLGFLAKYQGKFHLTDVSRNYLLPASPYYKGGVFPLGKSLLTALTPQYLEPGEKMASPEVASSLAGKPELARVLTRAMHGHSFPSAMGMAIRGDFTGVTRLLDAGGGSGCFSIALAMHHPAIRPTVMDVEVVVPITQEFIRAYGLEDRIETLTRDMFNEAWPSGFDAVLFSNIFHDFGWERCMRLARSAFGALQPGGRLYLHEMLLGDAKDGPLAAAAFSLGMVVISEGQQYTAAELETMTRDAGFVDFRVLPTYGYYSLVSARKP